MAWQKWLSAPTRLLVLSMLTVSYCRVTIRVREVESQEMEVWRYYPWLQRQGLHIIQKVYWSKYETCLRPIFLYDGKNMLEMSSRCSKKSLRSSLLKWNSMEESTDSQHLKLLRVGLAARNRSRPPVSNLCWAILS